MKYLNKRKFPRGIKRLHAGSQLLLHIGSTLEKGTRVTRGDYPAPVCLKDTTAKRRKALGRICRTTNVIKEFLNHHTPAATQLNSRRKKHEASLVKQALIGLSFPEIMTGEKGNNEVGRAPLVCLKVNVYVQPT